MIYLLEDDDSIRDFVIYTLNSQGMEARGFPLPSLFWQAVGEQMPALVLLDIMLPEEDGLSVLKKLRATPRTAKLPVIMLTAKGTEYDKVVGLDGGADDYVAKPFRPRELVSRIRSVLRRCGRDKAVVTLGDVQADIERGQVTKNGADVYLTALEYRLLLVFVNNRGKVLSRSRLLEEIWDVAGDFVNDNTLTVYIKRLREKIETDPAAPQIIRTVRGLGYRVEL